MFGHLQHLGRSAVHSRAIELLLDPSRYPAMAPFASRDCRLQLYTIPSFEPIATWTIYSSDGRKSTVRRVRWDRVADMALEFGNPTTFGADAWIETKVVDGYLNELSEMLIPPFRMTTGVGLDGTIHGVRRQTSRHFTEMSWWCEPAPGQEVLSQWYHQFINELENHLPDATDPIPKGAIPR
jgi:hypothetical protein